ncbi:MAG: dihydroorotate dehydrogenase, partial [Nitriliruptoraceae bacterium]
CFAAGAEMDRFYDINALGAVVTKSVTLEPREGLLTPRMAETPAGMLNAIGLQNPGIQRWIERDLRWLQQRNSRVIASIAGKSVDDFRTVARQLRRQPAIVALEVNLSCPNVDHRGLVFACAAEPAAEVVAAVARESDVPVFAKLTADVTDIVAIAQAVVDAGATGVTLINTLLGMAIDPDTGMPEVHNRYAGLSGPAIRPIALRCIDQVHRALPHVPIIGCGGVRSVEDVVQFTRAGARAVQIGTAMFVDPMIGPRLIGELRGWLDQRSYARFTDIVGAVGEWSATPSPTSGTQ